MEFYVARDNNGLHCFADCPDLVKFNPYSDEIEWTGYPIDFGILDKDVKKFLEFNPYVADLYPYDAPLHISISEINFSIL